jgi:hypothetical protein
MRGGDGGLCYLVVRLVDLSVQVSTPIFNGNVAFPISGGEQVYARSARAGGG